MSSKTVLIYRKRLLPLSETFIAAQGYNLPSYRPVFIGQKYSKEGLNHLQNKDCNVLSDAAGKTVGKLQLKLGLVSSTWLKQLRQLQPDILHAHFAKDGLSALPIAKALGIPLVVTLHGHDITKYNNAGQRGNLKKLFDGVSRIIAVSDFIADQAKRAGCPADKISQHYIGIDLEHFRLTDSVPESPTIVFVGRLVNKKGCLDLLHAVQRIHPDVPNLKVKILGDGKLRPELEAFVAEHKLNVDFLGAVSPDVVRSEIGKASVLCVPSKRAENGDAEGLGMVFLEAQAMGRPVVSYISGGVPEAVANQKTGLLVEEGNQQLLTEALLRLLTDKKLANQMAQKGLLRVQKKFDVRKQCAKLENLYSEVIHAA